MKQSILDAIPAKVALLNASGRIVAVNRGWKKFCEANKVGGSIDDDYLAVCQTFVSGEAGLLDEAATALRGVLSEGQVNATFRYPFGTGKRRHWYRVRMAPLDEGDAESGAIVIHLDITESVLAEQSLFKLAHYDVLTGLPNRALFLDRLQQAVTAAERHGLKVGVVFIDLDRFKDINDSLGHMAGDELLRQFGVRLASCVRKEDTVCRLGGDEFALILTHLNEAGDAAMAAHKLLETMKLPFLVAEREVYCSASLGIALFPDDSRDFETLLAHADTAMYRTKQAGHSSFQFYSAAMYEDARGHLQLENDLRLAVACGEFELYYQPKVSCASGQIVGAEALMRWHHPQRGMIPPTEFIPVLEELRLIAKVGAWAIGEVCRQIRQWIDEGLDVPMVAVNLSGHQFVGNDLVATVREALHEFRIPPASLELELTESILMTHVERITPILAELRGIGIRLSVDDFGTGYSSLAYLKQFPLDALKVDRSFIRDITTDPNDASITRAIITMAHQLNLKAIAEGVETEGQLAQLVANQCDEIQGFLFSPPVPAVSFAELLRTKHCLPETLLQLDDKQQTILVVDNEPSIIASLRRLLRREGYRVLSAGSPAEGLEELAKNKVDVVISDQRMASMTGVEFLRRVKSIHPGTIRMVLSGYTELQSVIDAINEGAVYRFVTKPWNDEQLKTSIREALRHKALGDENRLLEANLQRTNTLLASANRELQELLEDKQKVIVRSETTLGVTQRLLHQVPIAIIGVDDSSLIVFANRQAVRVLGKDNPLLGASIGSALPEALLDLLSSPVAKSRPWSRGGYRYRALSQLLNEHQPQQGKMLVLIPETEVEHV